jgi:cell wall-associated NlpC family hydrolase
MAWNKHAAALHARQNAGTSSQRRCGEFTRKAIRAGGVDIGNAPNAKDYGSNPERAGFRVLGQGETLQEGDVVVIQPYDGGNPAGHMAIYDGTTW